MPGRFRVDNLLEMLRRSHTAIWILSPAFIRDTMCLEMAHQAFIRLGHKKNLVVRRPEVSGDIERELTCNDVGQIFEVLNPKYGVRTVGYDLKFKKSERMFWQKIKKFLRENRLPRCPLDTHEVHHV